MRSSQTDYRGPLYHTLERYPRRCYYQLSHELTWTHAWRLSAVEAKTYPFWAYRSGSSRRDSQTGCRFDFHYAYCSLIDQSAYFTSSRTVFGISSGRILDSAQRCFAPVNWSREFVSIGLRFLSSHPGHYHRPSTEHLSQRKSLH